MRGCHLMYFILRYPGGSRNSAPSMRWSQWQTLSEEHDSGFTHICGLDLLNLHDCYMRVMTLSASVFIVR